MIAFSVNCNHKANSSLSLEDYNSMFLESYETLVLS